MNKPIFKDDKCEAIVDQFIYLYSKGKIPKNNIIINNINEVHLIYSYTTLKFNFKHNNDITEFIELEFCDDVESDIQKSYYRIENFILFHNIDLYIKLRSFWLSIISEQVDILDYIIEDLEIDEEEDE